MSISNYQESNQEPSSLAPAPISTPEKFQPKKLDFIDALRGIAALVVVVYHTALVPQPNLEISIGVDKFVRLGGLGVVLFFVISAFTLYLSRDNRKQETNPLRKFYLRRLFRIAPLFYCILAIHLAMNAIVFHQFLSNKIIFLNVIFAFNLLPAQVEGIVWASWTIGVEMLFYLIFPAIFAKVNTLSKSVIFIVFTIFISDIFGTVVKHNLSLEQEVINKYYYMNFFNHLAVFGVGILCYFIYRDYLSKIDVSNRIKTSALLISFSCLLLLALSNKKIDLLFPTHYWAALSFGSLILALSLSTTKVLVNKFTCFYGRISYSVYLIHPLVVNALIPFFRFIYRETSIPASAQFSLCTLLVLLLTTPLSILTYRLIELPGVTLGKRLIANV